LTEEQANDLETLKAKCAALEQERVLTADKALADREILIADCAIALKNQQVFAERQARLQRAEFEAMLERKMEEALSSAKLE
jgi:hypothetical protein